MLLRIAVMLLATFLLSCGGPDMQATCEAGCPGADSVRFEEHSPLGADQSCVCRKCATSFYWSPAHDSLDIVRADWQSIVENAACR